MRLPDPVRESMCGAFRQNHRWYVASDRRERHHQALAFMLGYIVVVSRIFRTFDQATAPVCMTCGW
jgi:hypothetical protein